MNLRRLCILIPSSLMLVLLLSLSSSDRSQHGRGFLANPAHTQLADGGGPVPPRPPVSFLKTLTADGGGSVPSRPPAIAPSLPSRIQQSPLLADGGGPVPPRPPVSFLKTLTADGGGPVPPRPPVFLSANSLAV